MENTYLISARLDKSQKSYYHASGVGVSITIHMNQSESITHNLHNV